MASSLERYTLVICSGGLSCSHAACQLASGCCSYAHNCPCLESFFPRPSLGIFNDEVGGGGGGGDLLSL